MCNNYASMSQNALQIESFFIRSAANSPFKNTQNKKMLLVLVVVLGP